MYAEQNAASGTERPTRIAALGYTLLTYGTGFSLGPSLEYLHQCSHVPTILARYPFVAPIGAFFSALLLIGLLRVWSRPFARSILLPWLIGPPVLVFILTRWSNLVYEVRYTLAAFPAFIAVVAVGIMSIRKRPFRYVAVLTVTACAFWSLANHYWNPAYEKENVRAAIAYMRAAGVNGPVLAVGQIVPAVRFYGTDLTMVPASLCAAEQASPALSILYGESDFWLLAGRDWDGQVRNCLARFERSHEVVIHRHFPGVDLWLFKQKSSERADLNVSLNGPD